MRRHRVQNKYTINFGKKIQGAMPRAGLSYKGKALSSYNLSVIAARCHCPGCGSQRLLRCRSHPAGRGPNSSSLFPPLAAVVAVAPSRRGFGSPRKVNGFARGSPTRGAVERSETERLYEGQPDREPQRGKPLRQCFALPPPLSRGGLGIPQSLAFSPEAPLGRGAVTEGD